MMKNKSKFLPKPQNVSFQEMLDGVIGVEYLLEINKDVENKSPLYRCVLCRAHGGAAPLINHLRSVRHKIRVLSKHFPTAYKLVVNKVDKLKRQDVTCRVARHIESTLGRLPYKQVTNEAFQEKRDFYYEGVMKGEHLKENSSCNFADLVSSDDFPKVVPCQKLQNNLDSTESRNQTTVLSSRSKDPLSSVSTICESWSSGSINLENFVPTMDGFQQQLFTNQTQTVVDRNLTKDIDEQLERELMRYKQIPEEHPKYREEWHKFWTEKYMDSIATGKEINDHEVQAEWIHFWAKRVVELHLEYRAKALRILGIVDPTVVPETPAPPIIQKDEFKIEPKSPERVPVKRRLTESTDRGEPSSSRPRLSSSLRKESKTPINIEKSDSKPKESPKRRRDSPNRRKDSPKRRRDSPKHLKDCAKRKDSPNRRKDSPNRRKDSPNRRKDSPNRRKDSPNRRKDSPKRRKDSPKRRRESPTLRKVSPNRRKKSPTRRRKSPSRDSSTNRRKASPTTRKHSPTPAKDTSTNKNRPSEKDRKSSSVCNESPTKQKDKDSTTRKTPTSNTESTAKPEGSSSNHKDSTSCEKSTSLKTEPPVKEEDSTPIVPVKLVEKCEEIDDIEIVPVLRLLVVLEDQLGSFGPKIMDLFSRALVMENEKVKSSSQLLDSNNCILLKSVQEKLRGQLQIGLVSEMYKKPYETVINDIEKLLDLINQRKKRKEVAVEKEEKPGTSKMDTEDASPEILKQLKCLGKVGVTEDQLTQLVKGLINQIGHAPSKPDEEKKKDDTDDSYDPFSDYSAWELEATNDDDVDGVPLTDDKEAESSKDDKNSLFTRSNFVNISNQSKGSSLYSNIAISSETSDRLRQDKRVNNINHGTLPENREKCQKTRRVENIPTTTDTSQIATQDMKKQRQTPTNAAKDNLQSSSGQSGSVRYCDKWKGGQRNERPQKNDRTMHRTLTVVGTDDRTDHRNRASDGNSRLRR